MYLSNLYFHTKEKSALKIVFLCLYSKGRHKVSKNRTYIGYVSVDTCSPKTVRKINLQLMSIYTSAVNGTS